MIHSTRSIGKLCTWGRDQQYSVDLNILIFTNTLRLESRMRSKFKSESKLMESCIEVTPMSQTKK